MDGSLEEENMANSLLLPLGSGMCSGKIRTSISPKEPAPHVPLTVLRYSSRSANPFAFRLEASAPENERHVWDGFRGNRRGSFWVSERIERERCEEAVGWVQARHGHRANLPIQDGVEVGFYSKKKELR